MIAFLDSLSPDLVYALRALRHNLTFTVVVVVTLAVGIGANTAVFSVVDGVLLVIATVIASYLPARRAVSVDPIETLRSE